MSMEILKKIARKDVFMYLNFCEIVDNFLYFFRQEMVNHMVNEHKADASTVYKAMCFTRFVKCPKCDEKFRRYRHLLKHCRDEHGSTEGVEIRCDVSACLF